MKYIRTLLFLAIFSGSMLPCFAQNAATYFNQFQQFTSEEHKNLDSAYYNAQQLATTNTELLNSLLLNSLLHDSFAYRFLNSTQDEKSFAKKLLQKLYAGPVTLQRSMYPLYKWVEVQNTLNDTAKMRQLVKGFLVIQERSGEEIGNRIDRYALLIYNLLKKDSSYSALADTLFSRTHQRLEHAVNGVYYQQTTDRRQSTTRAYFRYLMAYANLTKAHEAQSQHNTSQEENYLKVASQYSPDDTDRHVESAYFYEAAFLLKGQEDFHEPYVKFLVAKGDTTNAVDILTDMALADPGTLSLLKTYYQKTSYAKTPFQTYWKQKLNEKLKITETFQVTDLTGTVFDYEKLRGKWILIDFWGTWCVPCVNELPDFQKFYSNLMKNNPQNIVVFTVASHDLEPKVREFMKKYAYTFPVVMASETLIKQFRVSEYPTKVLITPQGNRMKIPYGTNWAERIKIYSEN